MSQLNDFIDGQHAHYKGWDNLEGKSDAFKRGYNVEKELQISKSFGSYHDGVNACKKGAECLASANLEFQRGFGHQYELEQKQGNK